MRAHEAQEETIDASTAIAERDRRHPLRLLATILLVGFGLRLTPILWGVPGLTHQRSYHPDEPKVQAMTAAFPRVYWTDQRTLVYGTVVSYTLGTALLPVKAIFVAVPGLRDRYLSVVWIISRLLTVLLGTGTIWLVYVVARSLFDLRTGLLAAAFLAVSFYHTLNSAVATLDVPLSFFVMLGMVCYFRARERLTYPSYVFLGITSGLLIGTKTSGVVFLLLPFIGAALDRLAQAPASAVRPAGPPMWKLLLVYVFVALAVYLIYHPHVLLDFNKYARAYLNEKHLWMDRKRTDLLSTLQLWCRATSIAVSAPITCLAVIGMLCSLRRRWRANALPMLFIALTLGFWRSYFAPRFAIGFAPILCCFAARTCALLLGQPCRTARGLGVGLAAASLGYSLYLCGSGVLIRLHDTRPPAARYIAGVVPEGTTVGFSSMTVEHHHPWRYPAVDFSKFRETSFLDEPDILIVSSFDLDPIEEALRSDKLLPGYRWDPAWNKWWYRYTPPSPQVFAFYDMLLRGESPYVLERQWVPRVDVPIEFPSPAIWIYRKRGDASQ